tara:strand:+ start:33842 stop:34999 length:1158 start_codon:yes stop_codon:yes gene_type:complete
VNSAAHINSEIDNKSICCDDPQRIFGGELNALGLPSPIRSDRSSLFAPRGLCRHPSDGSLWLSDTGHHRVLGWQHPESSQTEADIVLGQDQGESRNRGSEASANTLNVPCGICAHGAGIAVADSWNHRVLIWLTLPTEQQAPDIVLGQRDFNSALANRGENHAEANTLYWPSGVLSDGERLYIADTGNRRVLIWDTKPSANGQPADRVLGQNNFQCRDENGGATACAGSMRWPHALCFWQHRLCVADAGNNRVLVYNSRLPESHAQSQWILGQTDSVNSLHNGGAMGASAKSMSMPYGISSYGHWLIVADTANSRLLAWHDGHLESGAAAKALLGQIDFTHCGDNAWLEVNKHSLCWPYGIDVYQNQIAIADTGNSRVILRQLAL